MSINYTLYDVTVTTLTPLHIGTGRELQLGFDYVVHDRRTWRIDEDALLEAKWEGGEGTYDRLLQSRPPTELLDQKVDFAPDKPWFRYVLKGQPRSKDKGASLREQIKDFYARPYLPGSSLKGALRTALAWHGWVVLSLRPNRSMLGHPAKQAARQIEREIFGRDTNHDLLRALQVSDSEPLDHDALMLVNAQVVTRGGMGSPIEVEAIRPDMAFHLTMKLDEALFTPWAERGGVHFKDRADWLHRLVEIVRNHTKERIANELAWFNERLGAQNSQGLYRKLAHAELPKDAFLLQLGWGGGWGSKTLGSRLHQDEQFLEGIIREYKLDRISRGKRKSGDPFPKSRRVAIEPAHRQGGHGRETIKVPLGWVLVEMRVRG